MMMVGASRGHIPVWEDMLWSIGRGDAFMYKDSCQFGS